MSGKGWPKGKPRKLGSATVRRVTAALTQEDVDRMEALRSTLGDSDGEPPSDGDVVRHALQVAAGGRRRRSRA